MSQTQNINEIISYTQHYSRKDQLRLMRFGTVKPINNSDTSYTLQTNNVNSNSGFWTEIREDDFLYRIEYESFITPSKGLIVILQSSGNTFVPSHITPLGFEGLKNAIAFVFNTGMTKERNHGKLNTVSVYCDKGKGKGLEMDKFDYIHRQEFSHWPNSGYYPIEIMCINKTLYILSNKEIVISYQLNETQWKIISGERKYLGISLKGNGLRDDKTMCNCKNMTLNYLDCLETTKIITFRQKTLKTPSFVGKVKEKGKTMILIDGKDQTSALWFPIQFEKEIFVHFTVHTTLIPFEGFAFVLQNAGKDIIGEKGSGKGYKGINKGIAIEYSFLSFKELNDPYCAHIAIMCNNEDGISSDHRDSIGYNEEISKDMWKENKCHFEIFMSKENIVCWMNGKMMLHQKYEQFEKIIKKKMFIGITASSSANGFMAISDFGMKV